MAGLILERTFGAALKTVYDREIPAGNYGLGLIYKIGIDDDRNIAVVMTLTAPGCPVAGEMWQEKREQYGKGNPSAPCAEGSTPPASSRTQCRLCTRRISLLPGKAGHSQVVGDRCARFAARRRRGNAAWRNIEAPRCGDRTGLSRCQGGVRRVPGLGCMIQRSPCKSRFVWCPRSWAR